MSTYNCLLNIQKGVLASCVVAPPSTLACDGDDLVVRKKSLSAPLREEGGRSCPEHTTDFNQGLNPRLQLMKVYSRCTEHWTATLLSPAEQMTNARFILSLENLVDLDRN